MTVNPPVITETDSVTLHCQTPPSVSVSQCYFYTFSGGTRVFSCLKTLTGTELLEMSQQSQKPEMSIQHVPGEHVLFTCALPGSADHDVRCNLYFGEKKYPVPTATSWKKRDSKKRLICQFTVKIDDFLRTLLPPTLKVNSPEIRETDSVTLHCQTPPSVSVSHCYFRTVKKESVRVFPCMKTLTGTELLLMSQQSSPAEVQVKCFYTVKYEGSNHPSPHSDTSKTTMSVQHFPGETFSLSALCLDLLIIYCGKGALQNISFYYPPRYDCEQASFLHSKDCYQFFHSYDYQTNTRKMCCQESDIYHVYSTISEEPPPSALNDMVYSTLQAY
ncbi:hypothetical protein F7725_017036 [Dissostichus mawsoni]|uniref:Uncharacterized protein n=1 Tax=Dissostichus mawsoni TaxID=36200 RepID=A0A7J5Z485_DISMA|nr:hypothetical protein F7725_017036 [Dissostichus mawsoni]